MRRLKRFASPARVLTFGLLQCNPVEPACQGFNGGSPPPPPRFDRLFSKCEDRSGFICVRTIFPAPAREVNSSLPTFHARATGPRYEVKHFTKLHTFRKGRRLDRKSTR